MRLPLKTLALLVILALPVGTLMLAKLFNSAALGWLFGLMLMFGMAMVPLAAIAYAAYRLLRWIVHRSSAGARSAVAVPMWTVQVERGRVHASDDAPSRQLTVSADSTLREVIDKALADDFLPHISGGRATWVVQSPGHGGATARALAVWSQASPAPAYLIDPDQSAASHSVDGSLRLRCVYRGVESPGDVVDELKRGHDSQPEPGPQSQSSPRRAAALGHQPHGPGRSLFQQ